MKSFAVFFLCSLLFLGSCNSGPRSENSDTGNADSNRVVTGETPPSCFEILDNTRASIAGNWYSVGAAEGFVNNRACIDYDTTENEWTFYMEFKENGKKIDTDMSGTTSMKYQLRDNNRKLLVFNVGHNEAGDTIEYQVGRLDQQFLILMLPADSMMNRPAAISLLYKRK